MSNLRDMVVAINMDGIDIRQLLKMDTAIDTIESNILDMGGSISKTEDAANSLGRKGSSAIKEIRGSAEDAESSIDLLGDSAKDAGNDTAKGMHNAESATDSVGGAAKDAGGKFGGMKTVAVGVFAAITGAATATAGAVMWMAGDIEQAYDRLAAKTGATGVELMGLENVARDVFKNAFGDNIGQVSDDVAALKAMFKDLDNEGLQSLAEGAYTISDLWGPEVKEVGTVIKNMTGNFKDLSEQDALDLLTFGFQKTGDYSDDLLDTMKEYSPLFSALGLDAKDSMGLLIKGAEAGAWNMDKVGDAVKEFGIRGMDGSKASAEGYKLIGLNADEMSKKVAMGGDSAKNAFAATLAALATVKDPLKQNTAGVALFGTQWEDVRADVILSMQDSAAAVKGFEGATKQAADTTYDNFGSKMTTIWRTLKDNINNAFTNEGGALLLDDLATKAESLLPKFEDLMYGAIDFAYAVKDNWPPIRETIVTLGTGVLAFVGIMKGLQIISAINTLMIAWQTGTVMQTLAMWGLNTAMLANPMTWIVLGIAAVIAIGVLLWRNWDTVKEKAGQLWSWLKDKFGGIKDSVTTSLQPVMDFFDGLIDKWDSFKSKVSSFSMPKIGLPKFMGGNGLIQANGSHATGLSRVPWDGYMAELHKDEAVLTAQQSNALRNAGILDNGGEKPQIDMGGSIAPQSSKGGGNTFAPSYVIQIDGSGLNADEIAEKTRKVVKEENDKIWRQLNLAT